MMISLFFFFFFQAEDGIRDYKVTGVQTCALPISGKSGARASGSLDLETRRGTVEIRDLRVFPEDLEALSRGKPGPLTGEVRGQATVRLDGKRVAAVARLEAGGGKIALDADASLDQGPRWSVALQFDDVDPGAVARAGPNGKVTGHVEANGKGTPVFDEHGVAGDLHAKVHLGPARLERMGEVKADLTADLQGRKAFIRACTATALGLRVSMHGAAARDAMALDPALKAPDLRAVGKAIGAFRKKASLPLAGSVQLSAHVTGSPKSPRADLHLRAPRFRQDAKFAGTNIAVDGNLGGNLEAPNGKLLVR